MAAGKASRKVAWNMHEVNVHVSKRLSSAFPNSATLRLALVVRRTYQGQCHGPLGILLHLERAGILAVRLRRSWRR